MSEVEMMRTCSTTNVAPVAATGTHKPYFQPPWEMIGLWLTGETPPARYGAFPPLNHERYKSDFLSRM